ncbi:NAD(P)-binding protein [Gonapodya prolifera JEL478]|uniref:NAD(P)-binding protein n=1 Tax=Gonapodya prolifera (strain JEL478) TaxID=1344416 RepID=A0A139A3X0_GONPJ|nr:NAD(P)-binding protein [Gonapodya prolifera JEL478]|eukprot:KXS11502.1 NAD(P)-binding protein [Gonapodya prolifera JEL478]
MLSKRLVKAIGTPKVALVTGGASGIGRACAVLLAQNGAKVIVGDLPTARPRFDKWIGSKNLGVDFHALDVTNGDQWTKIMQEIEDKYKTIDVLVNNAGIYSQPEPTFLEQNEDYWRKYYSVNVEGALLGTREAIRLMKKSTSDESRSIINISSNAGQIGMPDLPTYCFTKGAVRMFTKSIALQVARDKSNIRVNSVHPGGVDVFQDKMDLIPVEQHAAMRVQIDSIMEGMHPIGRGAKPEDIANAVVFLASEESAFMTGSEVTVDGGYTAQ